MPIRRQAMQRTPFGEISLGYLKRLERDVQSGLPLFTGSAVLLDMLGTCNIPGFYPKDTNIFGRSVRANVGQYERAVGLIQALAGPNPHESEISSKALAQAYNNLAYRIATGMRDRIPSRQFPLDGVVYYIHSLKGRGINMYSCQADQPLGDDAEQVFHISRRGIFPEAARQAVVAIVQSGGSRTAEEAIVNYGTRLQTFGTEILKMCDAVPPINEA